MVLIFFFYTSFLYYVTNDGCTKQKIDKYKSSTENDSWSCKYNTNVMFNSNLLITDQTLCNSSKLN